jgi:hypothetical protein
MSEGREARRPERGVLSKESEAPEILGADRAIRNGN